MKNRYKFWPLILCIALLVLMQSSCAGSSEPAVRPDTPSDEQESTAPPTEEGMPFNYVIYVYRSVRVKSHYARRIDKNLWRKEELLIDRETLDITPSNTKIELKPWDESYYPIEPGEKIITETEVLVSRLNVSPSVYDFLESWEVSKKQFLICRYSKAANIESFSQKCEQYFKGSVALEGTEYYLWEGTAEELKSIAKELYEDDSKEFNCLICFPDDFVNLYGVTIEQAQFLIASGDLNGQCLPYIKNSPLYGMTPTEIAAYLADHPELLEENA